MAALPNIAGAQTTAGLDLDLTMGQHSESAVRYNFPLVPLPLFRLETRSKNVGIALEAVPPIGPVGYGTSTGYLPQATRLSYLVGTFRYYVPHSGYFVGVGSSILNQRTTSSQQSQSHGLDNVQASRVAGARFEAGYATWGLKGGFEAVAAVNPTLRANYFVEQTVTNTYVGSNGPITTRYVATQTRPEHGAQVEGSLRWTRVVGRALSVSYGVRYINYSAAYDRSGALADKNTFLMPFVGISRRFGP